MTRIAAALAVLCSACVTTASKPPLIYGLDDRELNRLGERFGYRVEALGMSDYRFERGRRVFHVWAHNDISVRRRVQSNHPIRFSYHPVGHQARIEELSIERGVPYPLIEEFFANFIRKVEATPL